MEDTYKLMVMLSCLVKRHRLDPKDVYDMIAAMNGKSKDEIVRTLSGILNRHRVPEYERD